MGLYTWKYLAAFQFWGGSWGSKTKKQTNKQNNNNNNKNVLIQYIYPVTHRFGSTT